MQQNLTTPKKDKRYRSPIKTSLDSPSEVTSLGGQLSQALSIGSLQKIPARFKVAITKNGPSVKLSSRAASVEKLPVNQNQPQQHQINSRISSLVASQSGNIAHFSNQDIGQALTVNLPGAASYQQLINTGTNTTSHQVKTQFNSPRAKELNQSIPSIQAIQAMKKMQQKLGGSFRDRILASGDETQRNNLSSLTEAHIKNPSEHQSQKAEKRKLDSSIRGNRISKLQQLLMPSASSPEPVYHSQDWHTARQQSGKVLSRPPSMLAGDQADRRADSSAKRFIGFKLVEQDIINQTPEPLRYASETFDNRTEAYENQYSQIVLDEIGVHQLEKSRQKYNRYSSQVRLNHDKSDFSGVKKDRSRIASQLSTFQEAPMTQRVNLAALQNHRLNEMREQIKGKVEERRSRAHLMHSEKDQAVRASAYSLPPIKHRNESSMTPKNTENKIVRVGSGPIEKRDLSKLSVGAEEYNRPERIIRPAEFTDIPMFEDHVGQVRPHYINMSEAEKQKHLQKKLNQPKNILEKHIKKAATVALPPLQALAAAQDKVRRDTMLALGGLQSSLTNPARLLSNAASKSPSFGPSDALKSVKNAVHKGPSFGAGKYRRGSILKKVKSKVKTIMQFDDYGARLGASDDEQVHAIVRFFQKRAAEGALSIMAGPPRKREADQEIVKGSGKRLVESLAGHRERLLGLVAEADALRQRQKSHMHLGSFNEKTIGLYQQLEELKSLLEQAKDKRMLDDINEKFTNTLGVKVTANPETDDPYADEVNVEDEGYLIPTEFVGAVKKESVRQVNVAATMAQNLHIPNQKQLNYIPDATEEEKAQKLKQQQIEDEHMQQSINEIAQKIESILKELEQQGPEVEGKLKSYVSVTQAYKADYPTHLPDFQEEMTKMIKDSKDSRNQKAKRQLQQYQSGQSWRRKSQGEMEDEKDPEEEKQEPSDFYKPYGNAQVVAYPEQAKIQNHRLEVFRYELGSGLVDALCQRIEQEEQKKNAIVELTLDQNGLEDSELNKILDALYNQGERFERSCPTINLSNNELGRLSIATLTKFMDFPNPDNILNLRLANLHISDTLLTQLFESLTRNTDLQRLRMSGIEMSNSKSIHILAEHLSKNETLQELDLSYCSLRITQLTEIFRALHRSFSLAYLSIAFNTNEYSRAPAQSEELFEEISSLLDELSKLVHLDLSGCNLGQHVLTIGPAIAKSLTLQAVHLHQNELSQEVKEQFFDILRIRLGVRQTRMQIDNENQAREEVFDEILSPRLVLKKKRKLKQVVAVENIEEKLKELKRHKLKIECTQFHGVGRRREVNDKLLIYRILGHQELNLFHHYNVVGWQVSASDQCYICENWKYTLFVYDRRKHISNKLFDSATKWIMERFNYHMDSDHRRRVPPTMTAPTLISHNGTAAMGNMLEYASRLNPRISQILEQTQVNASRRDCTMNEMIKFYLQNKVNVADNIALCMDLDLNEYIMKSLRYPEDTEIIGMPERADYFSREMEDDMTYVWAGFAKPGKHTVVINDPLNIDGPVKTTFLVGVRAQELNPQIAPQSQTMEEIEAQGASRIDSNILFGNWKKDTTTLPEACFSFDSHQIQYADLMKTDIEKIECQNLLKQHYVPFLKMYQVLASHSANFPLVDKPRFEVMCQKMNLITTSLSLNDCFQCFDRAGDGQDLNRPQFLRVILLLVYAKYLRPQAQQHMRKIITRMSNSNLTVKMPSELFIKDMGLGVKHFFEKTIPRFTSKRTWQEFRKNFVLKTKVAKILIDNMQILRRIYSNFSKVHRNKRTFPLDQAFKLIDETKKQSRKTQLGHTIVISDFALRTCWGLSKLVIKDMQRDFERSQHMVFVEFLEFICRIAHLVEFKECQMIEEDKKPKKGFDMQKALIAVSAMSNTVIDTISFKRPEESQEDDREEYWEEKEAREASESSDDGELVPSEGNKKELKNFDFLFNHTTMLLRGKLFRKKLKWLIILLGNVKVFTFNRQNKMSFENPRPKVVPVKEDDDELQDEIKSEDY